MKNAFLKLLVLISLMTSWSSYSNEINCSVFSGKIITPEFKKASWKGQASSEGFVIFTIDNKAIRVGLSDAGPKMLEIKLFSFVPTNEVLAKKNSKIVNSFAFSAIYFEAINTSVECNLGEVYHPEMELRFWVFDVLESLNLESERRNEILEILNSINFNSLEVNSPIAPEKSPNILLAEKIKAIQDGKATLNQLGFSRLVVPFKAGKMISVNPREWVKLERYEFKRIAALLALEDLLTYPQEHLSPELFKKALKEMVMNFK